MCGISGVVSKKNYEKLVFKMTKTLRHRGPDEFNIKAFNGATFGHARLSIIDPENGLQPMSNHTNNVHVTFNGEIYDYKKIRKTSGYHFLTQTDTEVILALYETFGEDFCKRLNGMFAFGLWDERKQLLILSRDKFGEKPLYYAITRSGELVFASEIKAIIATGLIEPILSKHSLPNYFSNLYIDPNNTIYSNIFTLPPGNSLYFHNGRITIRKYYKFPEKIDIGIEDAIEVFKEKFNQSIKSQLEADVEVGALLSGGVDSSAVVAVAKKYKDDLKTFSLSIGGKKDESKYANIISSKFQTNHYTFNIDEHNIGETFLNMQHIYDEPLADSSNITTYLITKFASSYTKVLLSGDGADELLGGYGHRYNHFLRKNQIRKISFSRLKKFILNNFLQEDKRNNYYNILNSDLSILQKHIKLPGYFNRLEIISLLGDNFCLEDKQIDYETEGNLNDVLKFDLQNSLAGDILVKTDRASMSNSVEIRSPFLDLDFSNFCISLPENLKIKGNSNKYILKKSLTNLLPKNILHRPKRGFGGQVNKWLKSDQFLEIKRHYFDKNREIFNVIPFEKSKVYFSSDNYQTWIFLTLSVWFEKNRPIIK